MHVVHVVRDLDETSGGISRSVPALASALSAHPDRPRVTVLFQDRGNPTVVDDRTADYRRFSSDDPGGLPPTPTYLSFRNSALAWGRLRSDALQFVHMRSAIDFIHLHGLWSPSVSAAAAFARRRSIPYAVAPRGMLSAWAMNHRKYRKHFAWLAYQKRDLNNAAFIHVTSEAERDDVLRWFPGADCRIIPNAIDTERSTEIANKRSRLLEPHRRWCVALGRIHPIKGLDRLIAAWAVVNPEGWALAIAGPDEGGYRSVLQHQVASLELAGLVHFLGPIGDDQTGGLLSGAELVVQASHSENFGIVIAESLAVGTPVIASFGTPWQSIATSRSGWWVDNGVDSLAEALAEATALSADELQEMGKRGVDLIQKNYGSAAVAALAIAAYRAKLT